MFAFVSRTLLLALLVLSAAVPVASAQALAPSVGTAQPFTLSAKLTEDGETIPDGLTWRVFRDRAGEDGKYPLVTTAEGGAARLELPSGDYLVHVAYGRAGATTKLSVGSEGGSQTLVLEAGGLALSATSDGEAIPSRLLRFSIYDQEQDEAGERRLIALNVKPDEVLRLNAGTYHVLSRYGTINATVRADLQVKPGKLTRATLQHRGAEVSLRLVSRSGGDAIANTSWTVSTQDGQPVFTSTSVSPSLVLAEGTYEAVAKNGDNTYRQTFLVRPGLGLRVEVKIDG